MTDPPYGVAYEGKTKDALTIANDSWECDSDFVAYCDVIIARWEGMTGQRAVLAER